MPFYKQIRFFTLFMILLIAFNLPIYATKTDTTCYVYVSLKGDNAIAIYSMDLQDGSLEKIDEQTVSGGPASIAIHPSKQYLYVAQRSSNSISAYMIDKTTGKLSFINTIPAIDNPVYLATDKSGRFLLSAYFGASKAAVYPIDTSGALKETPVISISTDVNPHAIVTNPSNEFLYITNMTGNSIFQYRFDTVNGTFLELDPADIVPQDGTGPRHIVFHGSKSIAYVVNETGNSVTTYKISKSGTFSDFQTISTLPADYVGSSKSADIHITPDNRFLYASNRGYESIAAFKIDADNDSLTAIGYFNTVTSPREFDIDPTGTFLYAAGETSNNLAWYRIDKASGKLDSLGCFTIGSNPSWVSIVGFTEGSGNDTNELSTRNVGNFQLSCSPNPFKSITSISFYLEKPSRVKITIYDISGKLVNRLVDNNMSSGIHMLNWDTKNLPTCSGKYLCSFETDYGSNVLKLLRLP